MFSADELIDKLSEIHTLIREKKNPDGTLGFDPRPVMVSLELARRMVAGEEPQDEKSE